MAMGLLLKLKITLIINIRLYWNLIVGDFNDIVCADVFVERVTG